MKRILLNLGLLALAGAFAVLAVDPGHAVGGANAAAPARTAEATFLILMPVIVSDGNGQAPAHDMVEFLTGDGRLYEVQHSSGSQARHQTQMEGVFFFHTKGNEIGAEWEELWYDADFIYRGTDTSPGNDLYYSLRDPSAYGSVWAPRFWNVGDLFERNPLVTFYRKSDCGVVISGSQRSWLKFEAYFPHYTFASGLILNDVVQLAWLLTPTGAPEERYFYAANYGLVGWSSSANGLSYVSEIHAPGARPDNARETIPCMDTSPAGQRATWPDALEVWPGDHRR